MKAARPKAPPPHACAPPPSAPRSLSLTPAARIAPRPGPPPRAGVPPQAPKRASVHVQDRCVSRHAALLHVQDRCVSRSRNDPTHALQRRRPLPPLPWSCPSPPSPAAPRPRTPPSRAAGPTPPSCTPSGCPRASDRATLHAHPPPVSLQSHSLHAHASSPSRHPAIPGIAFVTPTLSHSFLLSPPCENSRPHQSLRPRARRLRGRGRGAGGTLRQGHERL